MDPYLPPKDDPSPETATGTAVEDHRLYDMVLTMVLWGEKKEDVYHRLEVNGVTGVLADGLYQHARGERIATIRAVYRRKFLIGCGLVVAGGAAFAVCWFGLGGITGRITMICFGVLGVGLWKFIDGLAGYLMAPNRQGSVADDF